MKTKTFILVVTLILLALGQSRNVPLAQAQTGTVDLISQIGGATNSMFIQGNYAYVCMGRRLVILDITNPAQPIKVGESPIMPDVAKDVVVSGNYAYVVAKSFSQQ